MSLLKGIIKWLFPVQVEQVIQETREDSWNVFMKAVNEYNMKPENVRCQISIMREYKGENIV